MNLFDILIFYTLIYYFINISFKSEQININQLPRKKEIKFFNIIEISLLKQINDACLVHKETLKIYRTPYVDHSNFMTY